MFSVFYIAAIQCGRTLRILYTARSCRRFASTLHCAAHCHCCSFAAQLYEFIVQNYGIIMNVSNVLKCFSRLVSDVYPINESPIMENEIDLANNLFICFEKLVSCYEYENVPSLTVENSHPFDLLMVDPDRNISTVTDQNFSDVSDDSDQESDLDNEVKDPNYVPMAPDRKRNRLSMEQMKKIVDFCNCHESYSFRSIQNRFRGIHSRYELKQIKKLVAKGGRYLDKVRRIENDLYEKFHLARRQFLPIHDIDLRCWALKIATSIGFSGFKASKTWLSNFKRKYRITSRKVTMTVTDRQTVNNDHINATAKDFRESVLKTAVDFSPDQIFNSDQSGFNYEYHSSRTLSEQGEKTTVVKVSSTNKCSHSYTIQPIIDQNGGLRGKLYLCLQEPTGRMGPVVEKTYFRAPNVEITCSSSGKLTSSLFERFVNCVLYPLVDTKCLVLLDSWTGQQQDEIFSIFDSTNKTCARMKIPEKTTNTTQPLDVFFFRQWKMVVRRFYDHVMLHDLPISLGLRDNIIKMQSLVHNQFSHEKFAQMGHFAWFMSGLRADPPGKFKNAAEILFPFKHQVRPCVGMSCSNNAFIRCSYCDAELCFHHFFEEYHVHFEN